MSKSKSKGKPPKATDGGAEWMMRAKLDRPGGLHGRRKPTRQATRAAWSKDQA